MPTPEQSFIDDLKKIDKDLGVEWNKFICRFIIFHLDRYKRKYPVLKVQYKDGSFKPLDKRTLDALWDAHILRQKKPQAILYEIDEENARLQEKKHQATKDRAKAIASDIPHGDTALKEWAKGV